MRKMTPKEFRERGYLQEVNRCFLHPLGLALEVVQDADGTERFGEVQVTDDEAGTAFEDAVLQRLSAWENAYRIEQERQARAEARRQELGDVIQPLVEGAGRNSL